MQPLQLSRLTAAGGGRRRGGSHGIATMMMVKVNSEDQVGPALKKMLIISSALMAIVMLFVTKLMLPDTFQIGGETYTDLGVYFCFLFLKLNVRLNLGMLIRSNDLL